MGPLLYPKHVDTHGEREGYIAFTEAVASKPVLEAKRWMGGIRRKLQDPNRVPGPGLSVDRLDAYADHFANVFNSETWKAPPLSQRITAHKGLGFTYHTAFQSL